MTLALKERIAALDAWGGLIDKQLQSSEWSRLIQNSWAKNGWFSPDSIREAVQNIAQHYLSREKLEEWVQRYDIPERQPRPQRVGLVMAGNVPLVGFHDLLSVLVSGHIALVKMSSKDNMLLPAMLGELVEIAPEMKQQVILAGQLKEMDAVIATGSSNSARYFNYYFEKYPHIIRRNRNSVAVLTGNESEEQVRQLGKDIFTYYGLGCRNVSKVYVPKAFDFPLFIGRLEDFQYVLENTKYANNYMYYKSLYLLNRVPHLDSGFMLMKEDAEIATPVSVLNYETYESLEQVQEQLAQQQEQLQVVVSSELEDATPFGEAQHPQLWDYADGVDTMKFLLGL